MKEVKTMPVFDDREDIIGYCVGKEVYHPECFNSIEQTLMVDDVVRADDPERTLFFCDKCGKEIE